MIEANSLNYLKSSKFVDTTLETKEKIKISFHKDIMLQFFSNKEELDKFIPSIEG